MGNYLHLSLPQPALEEIDAKAKQQYLTRAAVARQYLLRALLDDTVASLRRRRYSVSKIAELLEVPAIRVYEALKRTQIDEEVYPDE